MNFGPHHGPLGLFSAIFLSNGTPMLYRSGWPSIAVCIGAVLLTAAAYAQSPATPKLDLEAGPKPAAEPIVNSAMDDRLLYQLLIAELALTQGDPGTAYDWILDAARRTKDEQLFRRATDIALQSRAGEQALTATRAWRTARPESLDALRMQMQIFLALGRAEALPEPLRVLLTQTPAAERNGLIAALPRFLQRANSPLQIATLMEDALKPYRDAPDTRLATRVTLGRAWMQASDGDRALVLARDAQSLEPQAPGPALLALELMATRPAAEALVQDYLARPGSEPALRQAYVRTLTGLQRYADAIKQLETAVRQQPDAAPPYLSLGALHIELKHYKEGEAALQKYLQLLPTSTASGPNTSEPGAGDDDDDNNDASAQDNNSGQVQAWLMLAQAAEQRADYKAAESWLAKVEDPQRALDVQTRRAAILARQGKLAQARELIRATPERKPEDARTKLLAEATVLRENKRWKDAYDVLAGANTRFKDDADLLYEQAMLADKLERHADMEGLLKRVIVLKPESPHAHNALGYSLADRNTRLPEAKQLITRALELSPGDPFITDSLAWVEFRLGQRDEALRLLRQAYAARPDTEIGAHLGEVLWSLGQKDEARRIWREAKTRDAANDVLRDTLTRLRADL
jgi:tetratricopeptide (TPR) repeat protein